MKNKPQNCHPLLVAALQSEIDRLQAAKKKLRSLDPEFIARTIEAIGSVEAAALWLTGPAYGLKGRVPVDIAVTAEGRPEVLKLLGRIKYNVPS